jgi:hypothetical protein
MQQKGKYSTLKFTSLIAAFLVAISVSTITFGGAKDSTLSARAIKTITAGINSPNQGVAQSSIYLAGYYRFLWAVEPLINVLNDASKETLIRILAAYSLNMIGEEKGMQAIKTVSIYDKNYMLQEICEMIYNNYLSQETETASIR